MSRTYKPRQALSLPRLDAVSAAGLALLLIAAAEPPPQPGVPPPPPLDPPVAEGLVDVKIDLKALQVVNAALDDKPGVRAADLAEDNAFSLTRDWLVSWARLPEGDPKGDIARALLHRLFPDGLDFLKLPVEKQRGVCQSKLDVIADEKLAGQFTTLGGDAILDHVQKTNTAYAAAIDAAKAAPVELGQVREKLDALLDTLQLYLVRVMGSVKRGQPETQARADDLLRPLLEWDRSGKHAAKAAALAAAKAAAAKGDAADDDGSG